MLVISRKVGQTIDVGLGLLQITITSVRGGVVRVGIEAPRSVEVFRAELLDRLRSGPTENPPVLVPESGVYPSIPGRGVDDAQEARRPESILYPGGKKC